MCCGKNIILPKKTGVVNNGLMVYIKFVGKTRRVYSCPSGVSYTFLPNAIKEMPVVDAEYLLTFKEFESV